MTIPKKEDKKLTHEELLYNEAMGRLANLVDQISTLALKTQTVLVSHEQRIISTEKEQDDILSVIEKINEKIAELEKAKSIMYGIILTISALGIVVKFLT